VVAAIDEVHKFIRENFKENIHRKDFPVHPNEVLSNSKAALHARETFCMREDVDGGNVVWNTFMKTKEEAIQMCSRDIAPVMEGTFGMEAIHIGNAPHDLPKPGGQKDHGYRTTEDSMLSARDILER